MRDPEREIVRRLLPWSLPASVVAFTVASLVGGWPSGWSALIGIAVVTVNLVAFAMSLAWAARISPSMVFAVGMGGFALRLGAIALVLALLNDVAWFSTVAFVAAVVPATIGLLVAEAKLLSGRMQVDLWQAAREAQR